MEYFIPGLGVCEVKKSGFSSNRVYITIEAYEEDLIGLNAQVLRGRVTCCGVCGKSNDAFEDDYMCIECRESQGDIHFDAEFDRLDYDYSRTRNSREAQA